MTKFYSLGHLVINSIQSTYLGNRDRTPFQSYALIKFGHSSIDRRTVSSRTKEVLFTLLTVLKKTEDGLGSVHDEKWSHLKLRNSVTINNTEGISCWFFTQR